MSEDLYTGPTILAPGANDTGRRLAGRLLVPLSLLFVGVLLVFYVLFTSITVKGESMEPALLDGDRLLITKSYDSPSRGDIVVFATLDRHNQEEDLVKRVIAVPGDTVEVRQGIALVNGAVEDTPGMGADQYDGTYVAPYTVPPGHVFVLGDNRRVALDSRELGPVPSSSVSGKAVFRYAPITRSGLLD